MNHLIFSELIKNSRVKPDYFITNKIDEIDFPLKHINFIKVDLNNLMFNSFNEIVQKQKDIISKEQDVVTDFNSTFNFSIDVGKEIFEIKTIKNKKECPQYLFLEKINFDDVVLTDDFIDLVNKHYVIISLVCAISFDEAYNFIVNNKDKIQLNQKFIYDELLSFWTNNFKNDFCYFNFKEDLVFEEREIEYCLIQFYFNYYRKMLLDISQYSGDEHKILKRLIEDKSSYKWYVMFGFAIWQKIKNKFKNEDDTIYEGINRFKNLNYKIFHKIFDDMIN